MTFLRNHNAVVATITMAGAVQQPPFEAADVTGLGAFGDALRSAGYKNTADGGPLFRFALGFGVDRRDLPAAIVEDLVAAGIAKERDGRVRLHGAVLAAGNDLLAFLRRDGARTDRVYVGPDSLHLVEVIEELASPADHGGRAIDVGTGTGLIAACLARTYRTVVATDLAPRLVSAARLTMALNAHGDRVSLCIADVAAGLRSGSFDFVTANTPWVPSPAANARLFADGGPTGMELPCRFVREGRELLRPGGIGVFLMADVTFANSPFAPRRTGPDRNPHDAVPAGRRHVGPHGGQARRHCGPPRGRGRGPPAGPRRPRCPPRPARAPLARVRYLLEVCAKKGSLTPNSAIPVGAAAAER